MGERQKLLYGLGLWLFVLWLVLVGGAAAMAEEYVLEGDVLRVLEGVADVCLGFYPEAKMIVLPASVKDVFTWSMGSPETIEEFRVDPSNPWLTAADGVLFSKDLTELVMFPSARVGSYEIPGTVEHVRFDAFQECQRLEELRLGEGIRNLERLFLDEYEDHYGRFPKAERLVLPDTASEICMALLHESGAREIVVKESNPYFHFIEGVLFSREGKLVCYPTGRTDRHYDVPEETVSIGASAFADNHYLQTCSLPESVILIEEGSFYGCVYLEAVYLPIKLEWIGDWAFADCVHLRSAVVSPHTKIGKGVFENCPRLGEAALFP